MTGQVRAGAPLIPGQSGWHTMALCGWALLVPAVLPAQAQAPVRGPVTVRYSEGTVRGFLELRDEQDSLLAHGDLVQVPGDSAITTRVVLRFLDRSVFEETTTFTQHRVFRLVSYQLRQTGPRFPADLEATIRADGHYAVTSTPHPDQKPQRYTGRLELPADVANGLPGILTRNLRSGDTADVHIVAFTPKPRLVGLRIAYSGVDSVRVGGGVHPVARFRVKAQLGALTAFFARLLGKLPADSHIWMLLTDAPAFIRFEGPMFFGPVWRLSAVTPIWGAREPAPPR